MQKALAPALFGIVSLLLVFGCTATPAPTDSVSGPEDTGAVSAGPPQTVTGESVQTVPGLEGHPAELLAVSLEDLSLLSQDGRCVVALYGAVYDLTSFVPETPADDALLGSCGTDATAQYPGTPADARERFRPYQLATLAQ